MSLRYCQASTNEELKQILALQQKNLLENVSSTVQLKEGFVSARHDFAILKDMNDSCAHIIAKNGQKVVAYALCMHPKFRDKIELLRPMFQEIASTVPSSTSFMVMGQICIDEDYRKQGVFRKLYETMKNRLQPEFDCIITSVDTKNRRSLEAHYAIGFSDLKTFSADNRDWKLIILE